MNVRAEDSGERLWTGRRTCGTKAHAPDRRRLRRNQDRGGGAGRQRGLHRPGPAATPGGYDAALETVREVVAEAEAQAGVKGATIGVGMPGSLSPKTGRMRNANSLWLNGKPFHEDLERVLGRPVRMENDANCFALSEAVDGAGKGAPVVFGAILGTGCGGGVVVRGHTVEGVNRIGGEWGHSPLPWPSAGGARPRTPAGAAASTAWRPGSRAPPSAPTTTRRPAMDPTGDEIVERRRAGEAAGRSAAYERYVGRLGRALAVICDIIDPDVHRLRRRHVQHRRALRRRAAGDPPLRLLRRLRDPGHARRNTATPRACAGRPGSGRRRNDARSAATVSGPARPAPRRPLPQLPLAAARQPPELAELSIAHMDCDAFYASVEKRDRPELRDEAADRRRRRARRRHHLLLHRPHVRACARPCRCSRRRKLCPQAVVLQPDFAKYRAESRRIMAKLHDADAAGAAPVARRGLDGPVRHRAAARRACRRATLARLQAEIERDVGITVSIGLAANKFLAKIASDLDKPRGFAVIGARGGADASSPRARSSTLPGVGPAFAKTLESDGYRTIGDLARAAAPQARRPLRRPRPATASSWPTARTPAPSIRTRPQERVGRDHLQRGSAPPGRARGRALAPVREACADTPAPRRSPGGW